ncbi:SH3 domain protein [Variovorax sp. PBL-H6]|uniref:SH3 domain-containing protein n=1 Tax=Variovorax sp. PBL-H6 TaxID=434009 RepID=UPI001317F0FE|nr:SH3 domain-containing protein [Variovorax sp. PBL-H6]VTU29856.1 SH3 domain protein [Variovorax sp. PBL-H6]
MNKPRARQFLLRGRQQADPPETVIATELADGEGAMARVYALPGDTEVLKRFRDDTPQEAARLTGIGRKIEAMLACPPGMQVHLQGNRRFVQIAWPQRAVVDRKNRIVGFTMPRISADAVPMTAIFSKRNRQVRGLRHDLAFRLYVAVNLCNVINYVRAAGHLVMDFNAKNFVIDRNEGWVGLLDCDGFAVFDGQGLIPADAVKPDEVAPEFRSPHEAGSYDVRTLDERQTRFGLAVTLFRLFNSGNSPAAGRHLKADEPSGENERIAGRLFSVDPRRAGLEPRGDITYLFEDETLALFRRAFLGPDDQRPSPAEWAAHFRRLTARSLRRCPQNPADFHFSKPCMHCGYQPPLQASVPPGFAPAPTGTSIPSGTSTPSGGSNPSATSNPLGTSNPSGSSSPPGTNSSGTRTPAPWPWKPIAALVGCAFLLVLAVRWIGSANTDETPSKLVGNSTSSKTAKFDRVGSPPAVQPASKGALAVAAINVNLRSSSTGGAPRGKLARGTQVELLEEAERFLKVRTSSGEVGWLARDYVINAADLPRLQKLTPQAYVQGRRNDSSLVRLKSQIDASGNQRLQLLRAIRGGATDLSAEIARLDASRKIDVPADVSAARWFKASAEAARNERDIAGSREFFRAAVEADPADPSYHSGVAFTSYELGDYDAMMEEGAVLLVLAPQTTNTWYVNGFAWAADPQVDRRMAATALYLAQKFSEDPPKTRQRMAAESKRREGSPLGVALAATLSLPAGVPPAPTPETQAAPPPAPAPPVVQATAPAQPARAAGPTIDDLATMMTGARERRWGDVDRQAESIRGRGNWQRGNEAVARSALEEGQRALDASQYSQAVDAFRRAAVADPSNPLAPRKLGQAYSALGQAGPARSAYIQSLLIEPGSGFTWAMLSNEMAVAGNPPDDVWLALRLALLYEADRRSLVGWIQGNASNARLGPSYRNVNRRVLQEVASIPMP